MAEQSDNRPEQLPDAGAPDPDLKNSPIEGQWDEDAEFPHGEAPNPEVCYFNDETYAHGTYIRSASAVLRCERGYWVEAGPADPDNP